MRYGISLTAVFLTFCYAFRLGRVFQRNVMDFVPAVQMTKHLQSADLAAFGGGVQEMGIDPKNLHLYLRTVLLFDNKLGAQLRSSAVSAITLSEGALFLPPSRRPVADPEFS